jgi:hypothetical protein
MTSLGALAFKKLIEHASPKQVEEHVPSPIRDQFLKKIKSATKKYKSRKEANTRKCHPDNINKLVTKKDLIDCILLSIPSLYKYYYDDGVETGKRRPRGLVVSKLKASSKDSAYDMKMGIVLNQINRWVLPPKMRISLGQFKRIIDILFTKFFKDLFRGELNNFIEKIERHGQRIQTKKHKISPGKTVRSKSRSRSDRMVDSISSEKMFRFIKWIIDSLPRYLKDNINVRAFRNDLSNADKVEFDKWVNNWVNLDPIPPITNRYLYDSVILEPDRTSDLDNWAREYDRRFGKNGIMYKKFKISYDEVIKFFEAFNHSQLQEMIVNTRRRSEIRNAMQIAANPYWFYGEP